MGRKLRLDIEGGWHHAMNRGVDRQPVFKTAADAKLFLWLVAEAAELFGVEVHAYALMRNHYHLLVHCPEGRLSEFMQRIGARYTRAFNARIDRDGPIFRGRFHSRVVDTPGYRDFVGRYIHRNPLDVTPPLPLDQYRWSSFGAYVGTVRCPDWLHVDALSAMHADRDAYREFVEGERPAGQVDWAIEAAVAELDHEALGITNPGSVIRTIAFAMLDDATPSVQQSLAGLLGDLGDGARRTARSRARRRVAEELWLAQAVERARRLAA
jgi:REP element-mobilizing transposase RayT